MQRRYLPIAILTGILFVTALVGYLIPARSEGPPTRVLLDNKGGKVIFTHQSHLADVGQDCASCHHTSGNDQEPPKCSDCHAKKFDDVFIADHPNTIDEKYCISCHHPEASIGNFDHDLHAMDYTGEYCQTCHHDESIEPEPQACSDCHEREATEEMPSLKTANHTRCADCHDDKYEQGIKECGFCHIRKTPENRETAQEACSSCHSTPVNQLVPTTTKAFHGQCKGCHEANGTGPYSDDDCYQCHMN